MDPIAQIVLALIALVGTVIGGLYKLIPLLQKRPPAKPEPEPADASGSYDQQIPSSSRVIAIDNKTDEILKMVQPGAMRLETITRDGAEVLAKTRDLHEWHDVRDPATGVRSWIVTPYLANLKVIEKHMSQQTTAMAQMNVVLEKLVDRA